MPQPTIARIERGTVLPRVVTLVQLLRATGQELTVEPIGPPVDLAAIRRRRRMSVPARTWGSLGKAVARSPTSPIRTLRRLRLFAVPFVLVGDLAEVAHGAPIRAGRVVEIIHPATDVARLRLALAVEDLGTSSAQLRTMTETEAGDDYAVLARAAVRMPVDSGVPVAVASIQDLIRTRRARGTPADLEAAAILRAIANEPADERTREGSRS